MIILDKPVSRIQLMNIEEHTYFDDMMKCVVDIKRECIAVNADLEELLLRDGSSQKNLYGYNILYDDWSIEYDSLINPPRNREAGYSRAGRTVADPAVREKIREVTDKWILK